MNSSRSSSALRVRERPTRSPGFSVSQELGGRSPRRAENADLAVRRNSTSKKRSIRNYSQSQSASATPWSFGGPVTPAPQGEPQERPPRERLHPAGRGLYPSRRSEETESSGLKEDEGEPGREKKAKMRRLFRKKRRFDKKKGGRVYIYTTSSLVYMFISFGNRQVSSRIFFVLRLIFIAGTSPAQFSVRTTSWIVVSLHTCRLQKKTKNMFAKCLAAMVLLAVSMMTPAAAWGFHPVVRKPLKFAVSQTVESAVSAITSRVYAAGTTTPSEAA